MEEILSIKGLSKNFGKLQAVQSLNLTIAKGQVFGLLGPNGSGKTTTLGMILDVVAPTDGEFSWFGGMSNVEARKKIGSILETPCFYPYLSAVQNLRIIGHIKQCGYGRIDEVLELVNLNDRKHDKFKNYSLGMKQRLSIAAALLADPPVLILDEPTNGLDPQGIAEIRNLIREIAAEGKTILLASHLLDEVQKVCSHFCVLRFGKKLHEGAVSEILEETDQIEIQAQDMEHLRAILSKHDRITRVDAEQDFLVLSTEPGVSAEAINQYCFEKGIAVKRLVQRRNSLEQEFLKILEEND